VDVTPLDDLRGALRRWKIRPLFAVLVTGTIGVSLGLATAARPASACVRSGEVMFLDGLAGTQPGDDGVCAAMMGNPAPLKTPRRR